MASKINGDHRTYSNKPKLLGDKENAAKIKKASRELVARQKFNCLFDNPYEVPEGMPLSVFRDRYARTVGTETKNGIPEFQGFADRVREMVDGNCMLDPDISEFERKAFTRAAIAGVTPLSGRHLQHGDKTQLDRSIEVFTNCSTAPFSFLEFYLLLNGSGVGRDYSSESCRVDWEFMPNIRLVLDAGHDDDGDVSKGAHPDFMAAFNEFQSCFDTVKDARHKYDSESEDVRWIKVRDSREGWAEVIATLETAAFHRNHADSLFIFDFSDVRPKGSPINGMQNRPAQGPLPMMRAIAKMSSIKGAKMKPWKQALFIDHYLAACVVVGNVRRSARMSTKWWGDRDVIEFIDVKRGGHLWSSNNSILVDKEFWRQARDPKPSHARRVFEAAVGAAYYDKTGEPGFINVDMMSHNTDGFENITVDNYLNPNNGLKLHPKTYEMIDKVLKVLKESDYPFITNPCQPSWAPVLTPNGIQKFSDISVGNTIWGGTSWVKVVRKWSTGVKKVYRYRTTAGVFYGTENHRVCQNNVKIEVGEASAIDICRGGNGGWNGLEIDPRFVIDGLMVGDGSRHMQSAVKVYLDGGSEEQIKCYRNSEVGFLIGDAHPVKIDRALVVDTTITPSELPPLPERTIPDRFIHGTPSQVASFLRGLFSANGSCNGTRTTLKTTSKHLVEQVQMMLSSLGIVSYYTTNKPKEIQWENGVYVSRESYDINIDALNSKGFARMIGFIQPHKNEALANVIAKECRVNNQKSTFDIIEVDFVSEEEVFDITVDHDDHVYWSGGCMVSNCGEIVLSKFGGYCVIGDVVLSRAQSKTEAIQAAMLTARALVRTNRMPALYQSEVNRTNRIGVGITGIFEYAWQQFKLSFSRLIGVHDHVFSGKPCVDKEAMAFWDHIADIRTAVESEATEYAQSLGMSIPNTFTTVKPSGTISKVMSCTEGAHLPPYLYYLRWTICEKDSPKHHDYVRRGYPVKDVSHKYHGCVVVGFPTKHPIVDIIPEEHLMTASDVTAVDQFKWVSLIERFWFGGERNNNQVSYTLKYDPETVTHDQFADIVLAWQPLVRCCAVMPFTDVSAYAYTPEEKIDAAKYKQLMAKIDKVKEEDYDESSVICEGKSCPIDLKIR